MARHNHGTWAVPPNSIVSLCHKRLFKVSGKIDTYVKIRLRGWGRGVTSHIWLTTKSNKHQSCSTINTSSWSCSYPQLEKILTACVCMKKHFLCLICMQVICVNHNGSQKLSVTTIDSHFIPKHSTWFWYKSTYKYSTVQSKHHWVKETNKFHFLLQFFVYPDILGVLVFFCSPLVFIWILAFDEEWTVEKADYPEHSFCLGPSLLSLVNSVYYDRDSSRTLNNLQTMWKLNTNRHGRIV